jgi:hypothetical protein
VTFELLIWVLMAVALTVTAVVVMWVVLLVVLMTDQLGSSQEGCLDHMAWMVLVEAEVNTILPELGLLVLQASLLMVVDHTEVVLSGT